MNLKIVLVVAGVALLFIGCSKYRRDLDAYKDSRPTAFSAQTIDWIEQSERDTSPALTLELPAVEPGTPRHPADEVGAAVFGISPAQYSDIAGEFAGHDEMEQRVTDKLRFKELLYAGASHSPEVQAAEREYFAMLNQFTQAEYLDQLLNQYRAFARSSAVETGQPMASQMSSETFPYPAVMTYRGEMVRREAELALYEWQQVLRDQLVMAGEAFLEYQYVFVARDLLREELALMQSREDVTDSQYRSGSASLDDFIMAQNERVSAQNMFEDNLREVESARARINSLLNRAHDAPLGPPATVDFALLPEKAELINIALKNRQELNQQETAVERTRLAIRMGEIMNRPLLSRGYSTFDRNMMANASMAPGASSFGLQQKTEIAPMYAQSEAYLLELREQLQASERMLESERAVTRSLAATTHADVDIARRQLELRRGIELPQAEAAYHVATSSYVAGRTTFAGFIESELKMLESELAAARAHRDFGMALLAAVRAAGTFSIIEIAD